jgi:hypothetical protein
MRKIIALAVAALIFGTVAQAHHIDPSEYTVTITVESSRTQYTETGSTVQKTSPSLLSPNGGARVRSTGQSSVHVFFVAGDSRYEVDSIYGRFLQPGEYKLKFNKQYVDILVLDEKGKLQACRYEIIAVEKVLKEVTQH